MLDTELIASGPAWRRTPFSSSTMKHTFLALSFTALASLAAAQQKEKKDPRGELANVIAVEEQERDLKKAETLYREAIADKTLSSDARSLATQRLGRLLKKLGRDEEAKQYLPSDKGEVATIDDVTVGQEQDLEREKALREKARELVKNVLEQRTANAFGIADQASRNQLIWIGEPAIPEIAAALAAEKPDRPFNHAYPFDQAVAGLAGLLWHFGGPAAESHLEALLREGDVLLRARLVQFAGQLREPRMQRLAERWLQQENDEDVAMRLLTSSGNQQLCTRLDADVVLTDAARRSPRMQAWMLGAVSTPSVASLSATALAKAYALVRAFLAGTDPELGQAAQRFLGTQLSQQSPEGVELLIQQLPRFQEGLVVVAMVDLPVEWRQTWPRQGDVVKMRREAAASLWPQLVACAKALPVGSTYRAWLRIRVELCARQLDAAIVPDLLALIEGGDAWLVPLLHGKVNLANGAAVFALYDRLDRGAQFQLLSVLGHSDLPAEMFESLRGHAAARMAAGAKDEGEAFVGPIGRTGNPDAATWLTAHLTKDNAEGVVLGLLRVARRTPDERVRAAMRAAVQFAEVGDANCGALLLALLALRDEPALRLVALFGREVAGAHNTFATQQADSFQGLLPIEYLMYENPDPPHGFTDEQIVQVVRDMARAGTLFAKPLYGQWTLAAIRARIFDEFARVAVERYDEGWPKAVVARIREDAQAQSGPLADWVSRMLRHDDPKVRRKILSALETTDVERARQAVEACVDDADIWVAKLAAEALQRAGAVTPERLARNQHAAVRSLALEVVADGRGRIDEEILSTMLQDKSPAVRAAAANAAGVMLSTKAVSALVSLLRDPSGDVRKAATDSLTRIRFHHEQESYWDRIVKGLDASPSSAAEKLLLQAKPGAPKAQRVLAITSLGTLGVPEALPFLIEWTQDADAEVAKKATEAITQIHLNPRK